MIRVRSFHDDQPLPGLDVTTGSPRVAVEEASERAERYGTFDDVSINFNDGSRAMRGAELKRWIVRHYPAVFDRGARRGHTIANEDGSR